MKGQNDSTRIINESELYYLQDGKEKKCPSKVRVHDLELCLFVDDNEGFDKEIKIRKNLISGFVSFGNESFLDTDLRLSSGYVYLELDRTKEFCNDQDLFCRLNFVEANKAAFQFRLDCNPAGMYDILENGKLMISTEPECYYIIDLDSSFDKIKKRLIEKSTQWPHKYNFRQVHIALDAITQDYLKDQLVNSIKVFLNKRHESSLITSDTITFKEGSKDFKIFEYGWSYDFNLENSLIYEYEVWYYLKNGEVKKEDLRENNSLTINLICPVEFKKLEIEFPKDVETEFGVASVDFTFRHRVDEAIKKDEIKNLAFEDGYFIYSFYNDEDSELSCELRINFLNKSIKSKLCTTVIPVDVNYYPLFIDDCLLE